jgi:hypothetical protein
MVNYYEDPEDGDNVDTDSPDYKAYLAWLYSLRAPRHAHDPDREIWTDEEWFASGPEWRADTLIDVHGNEKMRRMRERHLKSLEGKGRAKTYTRDRKRKSLADEDLSIEETFEYDPLMGKISRKGRLFDIMQVDPRGYAYVRYGTESLSASRLAWYLTYGEWPKGRLKWINGDTQDNRLANLRLGSMPTKRYQAQVMRNGVRVSLGYYETTHERDAAVLNYKLGLTPRTVTH